MALRLHRTDPDRQAFLAYWGVLWNTNGQIRCEADRKNNAAIAITDCRSIHITRGGPFWAIRYQNLDDGFIFRSQELCEAARRRDAWALKPYYIPSRCAPVSVKGW
jgi:hypothetical protein